MKSRIMHSWVLVLPLALYAQQSAQKASPDTGSLTPSERAVLRHLENDWEKRYRTTSINLAAEVLKLRISDASRLRLAQFIEANRSAFRAPARHRTTTVALTPQEKLIARAILLREAENKRSSTPAEIAGTLRLPVASLAPSLDVLQKFGVVVSEVEGKDRRYQVASQFPRRPSGRDIAFFAHRVTVNGRDKFEVA